MDFLGLVFAAIALAIAAFLCWLQAQRVYLTPLGTAPQRVASVFVALALVCAGFADRIYHQRLPDTVVTGTIEAVHPEHSKSDFALDRGSLQVRSQANDLLTLKATANLDPIKPGQSVRIAYDPVALLVRTVDILDPTGRTRRHFDNQASNRSQLGPWFLTAFLAAATAFPRRKYPPARDRKIVPYESTRDEGS